MQSSLGQQMLIVSPIPLTAPLVVVSKAFKSLEAETTMFGIGDKVTNYQNSETSNGIATKLGQTSH